MIYYTYLCSIKVKQLTYKIYIIMIDIDLDYYIQETDMLIEQIECDIIDYFEKNNITEMQVEHFTLCGEHIEKLIFNKDMCHIFYQIGGVKHRLDTLSISQIITLMLSI